MLTSPEGLYNASVIHCHSKEGSLSQEELNGGDFAMISVLGVFAVLILVGTAVDLLTKRSERKGWKGSLLSFLLGFSLISNTAQVFNTKQLGKGHLECLNGIRFLSMTWVLLSHVYSFSSSILFPSDMLQVKEMVEPLLFRAILNGYSCVESFFLLSGLLVAYLTFRELDRTKGRLNLALFYLHRYIRLSGTYALIIGFHATLLKYFTFGPANTVGNLIQGCQDAWWRNLLYINNLDMTTNCIPHTWYLAADMQMYWVSPLMVVPLWWILEKKQVEKKNKMLFFCLYSSFWVLGSTLILLVLNIVNKWPASSATEPTDYDFQGHNYLVPWCRFQPFAVGVLLGIILHKTRDQEIKINKALVATCWLLALALGLSVVYGLDPFFAGGHKMSELEDVLYGTFNRLAWALALGWVIFASARGYGGWINSFLSWEAFTSLSRLTLNTYLTHYTVAIVLLGNVTFVPAGTQLLAVFFICTVLVYSLAVSILVTTCIEFPLISTEKFIFPSRKRK